MGSSFIIILFFSSLTLFFLSSVAEPVNPHPQEPPFLKIREAHMECLYKVRIVTANSSQATSGNATIKFGDANGNEVYVQEWLQPSPVMTSGYDTTRACMDRVCYLFLRPDSIYGWTPATFTVNQCGSNGDKLTYTYNGNQPVLNNKWYGVNQCGGHQDLPCH